MNRKFKVLLHKNPDGGYTVTVPSLPGCVSEGDSVDEALENVLEAIRLTLDDMAAYGEPIPEKDVLVREVEVL